MAGLLIGEAARKAGVSTPTIRYYEEIRKAQALGFSLDEIGEILALSRAGQKPCAHVLSLAHQHLGAVDERIRRLQKFRAALATELQKWERQKIAVTCDGLCQFIADADAKEFSGV